MKKLMILCLALSLLFACDKAEQAKEAAPAKEAAKEAAPEKKEAEAPKETTKKAATEKAAPAKAAPAKAAPATAATTKTAPAAAPGPGGSLAAPTDVAAAPADAIKTASGLAYKVVKKGTGTIHPKATNTVEVHYSGWTTDGKLFDSSVRRGRPATFPLNRVIKGWTEGVQLMMVGEKTRFWIPGNLAYGDKPMRPGAPAGTLVFDVELLSIK